MDSLLPTYPPFSSSSHSSATNDDGDASLSHAHAYPRLAPSTTGNGDGDPSEGSKASTSHPPSLGQQAQFQLPVSPPEAQPHLYSPTRTEIEAHPIRQRLSVQRDEITTGYGTATSDDSLSRVGVELDSKQAREGSQRLVDAMSSEAPKVQEGDAVTYAWGSGRPGGEVTQVETNDTVTMETNRGNEVHKQGEPENPALYINRGPEHDVVKKASEVTIEEKADSNKDSGSSEKKDDSAEKKEEEQPKPSEEKKEEQPKAEEKKQSNGDSEPQTGDKRPASETSEEKKAEETNGEAKKQKTDDDAAPQENGEQPKKKGRPAKTDAEGNPVPKKETKKRAPKKAATESGEPRRSGRNAGK